MDILNLVLQLDQHLITFVNNYGLWTYGLLFIIIFCETGLVVTPILPGDSLLFAAGAIAAGTDNLLNIHILFLLLAFASILGNTVNYQIGRWVGPAVFRSETSRFFNKNYLFSAHHFYNKHGAKTLILARFLPIIRTFVPFVAGIGYMSYQKFIFYNVIGAFLWIGGLLYVSYWFGNFPIIKEHFSLLILFIIIITLLPPLFGMARHYLKSS